MLENVAAKCHTLCSCSHCPITHLQNFSVAIGFGSTSNYQWYGTTTNNPLKRIWIPCVYCFYDICSSLSTHPSSMCHNLWVMRVLNVLSTRVHHRDQRDTPLIALIGYHT